MSKNIEEEWEYLERWKITLHMWSSTMAEVCFKRSNKTNMYHLHIIDSKIRQNCSNSESQTDDPPPYSKPGDHPPYSKTNDLSQYSQTNNFQQYPIVNSVTYSQIIDPHKRGYKARKGDYGKNSSECRFYHILPNETSLIEFRLYTSDAYDFIGKYNDYKTLNRKECNCKKCCKIVEHQEKMAKKSLVVIGQ
jgi:hypothetical protein